MTAPNIVNVSNITGVTTFLAGISTTSVSVIISNDSSSNKVYKINTIVASNINSIPASLTVKIFGGASGAGTSVAIASTIAIPAGSSLAIIGKDTPIYLEENRSIGVIAITPNSIDIVGSYEIIS